MIIKLSKKKAQTYALPSILALFVKGEGHTCQ